jgi:hypothetical protein
MLRKSFARGPSQKLFLSPIRTLVWAALTAGLMPTALLILRLWFYASHQRFRAGELVRWLSDGSADARLATRSIRPTAPLLVAAVAVAFSVFSMIGWVAWAAVVSLPRSPGRFPPAVGLAMSVIVASLSQVITIFTLRLRMQQFVGRLNRAAGLRVRTTDPRIPAWTVWPMLLIVPWSALWLAGFRWTAWWLMPAIVATLAAETQRGYITVTDRRARYAIARRVGRFLPGRAAGGR